MSLEWKRATWTFDSSAGHTHSNIMSAIDTFLTAVGWVRAGWDTSLIRNYLRADRFAIGLTNKAVGTAGNVTITKTMAALTVAGMSGGDSTHAATGTLTFTDNPADGETVVISDGTTSVTFEADTGLAAATGNISFLNAAQPVDGARLIFNDGANAAVTFEFDSNSSVTQTSTLRQVVIGANIAATIVNLVAAINNPTPALAITAVTGPNSSVALSNDATGAAGNVAITKTGDTGGVLLIVGMAGGGAATVGGGNVPFARAATLEDTIANLVAAINANGFQMTALWRNRWVYTGDGTAQHCGLQITDDTANSRIIIQTFLENLTKSGLQRAQNTAHQILLTYQTTAPNNFLFIGGEYGFFGEMGRDGLNVNLGHFAVATYDPIASLFGTDDTRTRWTTQGVGMDLFGLLKFSQSANNRFVDSAGSNKNYTCGLKPFLVRGTTLFTAATPSDDPRCYIGPRDHFLSPQFGNGGGAASPDTGIALTRGTFGLLFTPRDGRYRISPLMFEQISVANTAIECYVSSSSVSNNVAASSSGGSAMQDYRHYRDVPKFVVIDATLVPFVTIVDQATGITYRITQVQDGGRQANLGVEWPDSGNVVTIPTAGA